MRISTTRCARRCTARAWRRTPPTSWSCRGRSWSRCCARARWTWRPSATGRPPSRARQAGGLRPILDDTDVLGEIAGGFAVLRRDWVDEHPEEARAFVDASARALDYARENPEVTREVLARALEARGENPGIARFFAGYGVREGGLPVERDVQVWIDVPVREGLLAEGQLAARDILLVTGDDVATN